MGKAQPDHYYARDPGRCVRCGVLRRPLKTSFGKPHSYKMEWSYDGGTTWTTKHQACPGEAMKEINGISRGLVVEKIQALDIFARETTYILKLNCEEDRACDIHLVVPKEMFDAACIAGLGHDTVIEYGSVLQFVERG